MKRKSLAAAALLAALFLFAGCTPSPDSLWVFGLGKDEQFSLSYPVSDNSFDGYQRTFSVKDTEAFVAALEEDTGFLCATETADEGKAAYLFESGGCLYYCTAYGSSETMFVLSPCAMTLYDADWNSVLIPYPPTSTGYAVCTDTFSLETVQDWSYFSEFYGLLEGAAVDGETKTVLLPTYSGTASAASGSGTLTWTESTVLFESDGTDEDDG